MKISKNNRIAIIIVLALLVIFTALLTFLLLTNEESKELYLQEKIRIVAFDEELGEYTLEELLQFSDSREFKAIYKPNNMQPIEKTYTGIYLQDLMVALGVDINLVNYVNFSARDQLQRVYSKDDIMQEDNVYIAYLVEGEPFNEGILATSYNKPQEDGGPFVVIKAKDSVSQNRVKLLVEISIE